MLAHLGDVVGGALVVAGVTKPPGRRLVVALDGDLVDDQPRAVAQDPDKPPQRLPSGTTWCSEIIATAASNDPRRRVEVLERDLAPTPLLLFGSIAVTS